MRQIIRLNTVLLAGPNFGHMKGISEWETEKCINSSQPPSKAQSLVVLKSIIQHYTIIVLVHWPHVTSGRANVRQSQQSMQAKYLTSLEYKLSYHRQEHQMCHPSYWSHLDREQLVEQWGRKSQLVHSRDLVHQRMLYWRRNTGSAYSSIFQTCTCHRHTGSTRAPQLVTEAHSLWGTFLKSSTSKCPHFSLLPPYLLLPGNISAPHWLPVANPSPQQVSAIQTSQNAENLQLQKLGPSHRANFSTSHTPFPHYLFFSQSCLHFFLVSFALKFGLVSSLCFLSALHL